MRFCGLQILESADADFLTVQEVCDQLHIDNFDDAKVSACIQAALSYAESVLHRSLRAQTILANYAPDGDDWADLTRGNVEEIESIKYFDGAMHEVSGYVLDSSLPTPRVYFSVPEIPEKFFAPVKIIYHTATPKVVPQHIKQAVLLAASVFYDNRETPDLSVVDKLLNLQRAGLL